VAYTSIKTTGGWSTNTVTAAYDLLFRWQLKAMPLCRQFVDVRPEQVTHRGQSVTLQQNQFYSESDVVAALTALDEETDVTPTKLPATTSVTLTPTEHGFANLRTLKLKNRGMVDIDPVIAKAIGQHCGDTIDRKLQVKMRTGSNVRYSGNATAPSDVDNADVASAADIRFMKTKLFGASVLPNDGIFYTGLFHPDVVHDLRAATGSGTWRAPKEYVDPGEIYRGEAGEFEGVRFVQSPTLLWSADAEGTDKDGAGAGTARFTAYRSFVLGQEALAEAVVTEPHVVLSPQVDMLRRNQGIGWYGDLDFGIYRQESIYRLVSGSSIDPS
jgi:N4-gp56 family major capsid protein